MRYQIGRSHFERPKVNAGSVFEQPLPAADGYRYDM